MIKVSIIIPVYNVEKTLKRAVHSAMNQTLKEIEIILVDDGTKDRSGLLADELAQGDERIKVIHKHNEGLGLTRNAGLKIAQGEYVGFLDSDDYVDPTMYETLYQQAKKDQSQVVYGGYVRVFNGQEMDRIELPLKTWTGKAEIKNLIFQSLANDAQQEKDSEYGATCWKGIYHRQFLQDNQIQFYSEREYVSEDSLYLIDVLTKAQKVSTVPGVFYFYEYNPASLTSSYRADRFEKNVSFYQFACQKLIEAYPQDEVELPFFRNLLAASRVCLMQEVFHENVIGKKVSKQNMHAINNHEVFHRMLKSYPWKKLPLKLRLFAWATVKDYVLLQRLMIKASQGA